MCLERQVFALYRLNLQIFPTNDALFKVWFIQDSGLFRVWFRQVSPYIHNESKLTKERKKNHGDKRLLTPFEGFFLLPQGEIIDRV